jgi:hypothetical protein
MSAKYTKENVKEWFTGNANVDELAAMRDFFVGKIQYPVPTLGSAMKSAEDPSYQALIVALRSDIAGWEATVVTRNGIDQVQFRKGIRSHSIRWVPESYAWNDVIQMWHPAGMLLTADGQFVEPAKVEPPKVESAVAGAKK